MLYVFGRHQRRRFVQKVSFDKFQINYNIRNIYLYITAILVFIVATTERLRSPCMKIIVV